MTAKQEAKVSMYDAVLQHAGANPAIVGTVPAYQTAITALSAKYSAIITATQLEQVQISGITVDKSVAKKNLAQQAVDTAAAVFAYAASIGNNELQEKARYPKSRFTNMRDELVKPTCQAILDLANANLKDLAPFGISAATITLLQSAINNYGAAVAKPRNAVSQRTAYRETIKTLIREADAILKNQLDKIAPQFKMANMEFYNAYLSNRIILDAPTSATQVAGNVTASDGNNPVFNVIIKVEGASYTTTTDEKGDYILKIPVPGTYNITFTHPKFQVFTAKEITVALGKSTKLNVQLS
jgi:hypothetical protein